jgi:hypothetical protein
MMRHFWSRPIVVLFVAAVLLFALATSAVDPIASLDAQAQTDPSTIRAIQTPPPVPGIDYSAAEPAESAPAPILADMASPVPPAMPANATKVAGDPSAGDSMTAVLGGSDIAVSSVGGSYERDGGGRGKRDRERRSEGE